MTLTVSNPPTSDETDVVRFLQRFADLLSNGGHSENLLRAAGLVESRVESGEETKEPRAADRFGDGADAETRNALKSRIGELEAETVALKSQLAERQPKFSELQSEFAGALAQMEIGQARLLARAEQAEARLAAIGAGQATSSAIPVPLSTLLLAKSQFQSLANAFARSGNIVSQVMCEASASSLDRVIRDAGVADEAQDRSQDAA